MAPSWHPSQAGDSAQQQPVRRSAVVDYLRQRERRHTYKLHSQKLATQPLPCWQIILVLYYKTTKSLEGKHPARARRHMNLGQMLAVACRAHQANCIAVANCPLTCRNCVHALRSLALNSYGTFQPMGPNLRRSWTTLCRKHMTNSSWRHSCLQPADERRDQVAPGFCLLLPQQRLNPIDTPCTSTQHRHMCGKVVLAVRHAHAGNGKCMLMLSQLVRMQSFSEQIQLLHLLHLLVHATRCEGQSAAALFTHLPTASSMS